MRCSVLAAGVPVLVMFALVLPASAAPMPGVVSFVERTARFPTDSPAAGDTATATLTWLEVTSIPDAALRRKVNALIGPQAALGADLDGLRGQFAAGDHPFDEAVARVLFSGHGILQVAWTVTATGAYTSVSQTLVNVDVRAGSSFGPRQVFADVEKLAGFLDSRMHARAAARMKAVTDANPDQADLLQDAADNLAYTPDMLDSAELGDQGMLFRLGFDFPHALAALEPDPVEVRLGWKELRPFLSSGSVLLRLAGR